jgi:hypothetical protein
MVLRIAVLNSSAHCHYAECLLCFVSQLIKSIVLSVIMLNVVAPKSHIIAKSDTFSRPCKLSCNDFAPLKSNNKNISWQEEHFFKKIGDARQLPGMEGSRFQ